MSSIVSLRPIAEADTSNIVKWRNSEYVKANLYTQEPLTEEQHRNWLKNKVFTGECAQFIIVVRNQSGNQDIGTVFIKNIDKHANKGEFGIFIGEDIARGKGYAKPAIQQILTYAFTKLNLNKVYLTVFSDNIAAIKAYEHAGFVAEGTFKQDYLRRDGYADVVFMAILQQEWRNQSPPKPLA